MGSWQIAVIRGIPIKIHWSFFIIPLFYAIGGNSVAAAVRGVVFILLVFACVALHELGHAVAAQYFGIRVREILLLPLGGLAQLANLPQRPQQELVIAVAGPAVNFAIALILGLMGWLWQPALLSVQALSQGALAMAGVDLLRDLLIANLALALFNLLPAFPMDGGRILRAGLGFFLRYEDATRLAVWVGRIFAVGFVLLGLLGGNFMLGLVGIFIYAAAGAEYKMIRQQAAGQRLRAGDVARSAVALHPRDLLGQVWPAIMNSAQPLYPVSDGGRLEGVTTPAEVEAGYHRFGPAGMVAQVTQTPAPIAPAAMPLAELHALMAQRQLPAVLVVDDARVVGVAAWEDVAREVG